MSREFINQINQKRGRRTGLAALVVIFILFVFFRVGESFLWQKKNAAESFDSSRVKSGIPFVKTVNAQECWVAPGGGGGGGGGCGETGCAGCGCGPSGCGGCASF